MLDPWPLLLCSSPFGGGGVFIAGFPRIHLSQKWWELDSCSGGSIASMAGGCSNSGHALVCGSKIRCGRVSTFAVFCGNLIYFTSTLYTQTQHKHTRTPEGYTHVLLLLAELVDN